MSAAILDLPIPEPSTHALIERALDPYLLIGMPHLNPHGLSETWLMKELGHRHWLMLACHLGMPDADFRTPDGHETYAAICATSLENARLDAVRANDVLTIRSTIFPVSRTLMSTRHRLSVRGVTVGDIELASTFVCRTRDGDNYSIARVPMPALPQGSGESTLARTAAMLRADTLEQHFDMPANTTKPLRSFSFQPDISQEFNGAGLFYFAEFQALTERAFGHWFAKALTVSRREIFFSGNIRPGESIRVELMEISSDAKTSFCRLVREDGKVIGSIFTAE